MSAVLEKVRRVERVVKSQEAPVGTFTVRRALPDRQRHSVRQGHTGQRPALVSQRYDIGMEPVGTANDERGERFAVFRIAR